MATPFKTQVFLAGSATKEDVIKALMVDGGCVIKGFCSEQDLAQIEKDIRPYIIADKPWEANDFFPSQTRRVCGLLGKSDTFANAIPNNQLYREVCDAFLTSSTEVWVGDRKETHVSKPQINNTIIFSIGPGARAQDMHRDDMVHHNSQPAIEAKDYKLSDSREVSIGCFVGGSRTTKANGATRFIPGSHMWDRGIKPNEDLAVYAELEKGDAFIMLSSCFHAGSANTTEDEERLVYSCFLTKGYLRQEENQYLAISLERMKQHPVEIQKLAGYEASIPYCGWVDLDDPRKLLLKEGENVNNDLFAH